MLGVERLDLLLQTELLITYSDHVSFIGFLG